MFHLICHQTRCGRFVVAVLTMAFREPDVFFVCSVLISSNNDISFMQIPNISNGASARTKLLFEKLSSDWNWRLKFNIIIQIDDCNHTTQVQHKSTLLLLLLWYFMLSRWYVVRMKIATISSWTAHTALRCMMWMRTKSTITARNGINYLFTGISFTHWFSFLAVFSAIQSISAARFFSYPNTFVKILFPCCYCFFFHLRFEKKLH